MYYLNKIEHKFEGKWNSYIGGKNFSFFLSVSFFDTDTSDFIVIQDLWLEERLTMKA